MPSLEELAATLDECRAGGDVTATVSALHNIGWAEFDQRVGKIGIDRFLEAGVVMSRAGHPDRAALALAEVARSYTPKAGNILLEAAIFQARKCEPADMGQALLAIAGSYEQIAHSYEQIADEPSLPFRTLSLRSEALAALSRTQGNDVLMGWALTLIAKHLANAQLPDTSLEYYARARPHLGRVAGTPDGLQLRADWHSGFGQVQHSLNSDSWSRHLVAAMRLYACTDDEHKNAALLQSTINTWRRSDPPAAVSTPRQRFYLYLYQAKTLSILGESELAARTCAEAMLLATDEQSWTHWALTVIDVVARPDHAPESWARLGRDAWQRSKSEQPAVRFAIARAAGAAFDVSRQMTEALEAYEWMLDWVTEQEEAPDIRASATLNVAEIFESLGRPFEAEPLYHDVLCLTDSDDLRSNANHGLASVMHDTGRLKAAEEHYRAAVTDLEPTLLENRHQVVDHTNPQRARRVCGSLHNLATVVADLGRLSEALGLLEHALWIARTAGVSEAVASTTVSQASILSELSRGPEAAIAYRSAYDLATECGAITSAAAACSGLARTGDEDQITWLKRACELWHTAGSKREEGRAYRRLASAYLALSDEASARPALEQALRLAQASKDLLGEGEVLLQLADRPAQSESPQTYRARALERARAGDDPSFLLRALTAAAGDLMLSNNYEGAAARCAEASQLAEIARSYRVSLEDRETLGENFAAMALLHTAALVAQSGAAEGHHRSDLARQAFEVAAAARGRTLVERLQQPTSSEGTSASDRRLEKINEELRATQTRLFYLKSIRGSQGEADSHRDEIVQAERTATSLLNTRDATLTERALADQRYGAAQGLRVSVDDIQQHLLDNDSAVIQYSLGVDSLYIFVVTATDCRCDRVPLLASELLRRISSLRDEINGSRPFADSESARDLYAMLVAPVLKLAGGLPRRLIISADGPLLLVPFAALPLPDCDANRSTRFLGQEHVLAYCPTPGATIARSQSRPRRAYRGQLVSFGDPITSAARIPASAYEASAIVRRYDSHAPKPPDADAVDPVAMSHSSADASIHLRTGAFATKEEFLRLTRLGSYRYIHLATHGSADSSRQRLSGLLFSENVDQISPHLTLGEIESEELSCELCVLSACNTGLGQLTLSEGIVGLARAFAVAGASSVCVSLWPVDDKATARLMIDLFERLAEGDIPPVALQEAQASARRRGDEHPRLWAPFSLII